MYINKRISALLPKGGRTDQTVKATQQNYRIVFVSVLLDILNPREFYKCMTGSKITTTKNRIGWILPSGGVPSVLSF